MNGLLKTLIKPDWDEDPKRSEIIHAANLLHIGEFQLIQLAYKVWYGEDLPENKINKIFNEYMVTGIVPVWVVYYARDILKLNKAKVLDGYNEKYHIYDNEFGKFISNENQRRKRGIIYTIIIVLVFIFSHFISNIHIEEAAGFYPPYIEKRVVYPEFDKKDPDYAGDKDK
tara:strand:- start:295 stop:807 length:513 start_codon:yes stop_codon:yes gene_type:complete